MFEEDGRKILFFISEDETKEGMELLHIMEKLISTKWKKMKNENRKTLLLYGKDLAKNYALIMRQEKSCC
jgi:hypothetical protein